MMDGITNPIKNTITNPIKLAIIASHPIQYYAPLFRLLAADPQVDVCVFYLWDFGITDQVDQGFKQVLQWDIPLLDGYAYKFVRNDSQDQGTHHIWGLQNPSLTREVIAFQPDAIWLTVSYNYASIYRLLWNLRNRFAKSSLRQISILFRGDSHRIAVQLSFKNKLRRFLIGKIIQQIFKNFDACLYVGKANYEYFQYHGIPKSKLFFTPHAIDSDRFTKSPEVIAQAHQWKQELGINPSHQVILFAGKFEPQKRPLDIIRAFWEANLDDVSLLLVGSGILEAEMRQLVDQFPSQSQNIFFAPFQNQSLMPRTYAIADLLVLPSYSETWGLAVNEAMAMGLAIIVSNHVGCAANLVNPDVNGLIFEAGNVEELAKSLQFAFSDRDRLKQWGEASQIIIANYSYQQAIVGIKQALAMTCSND